MLEALASRVSLPWHSRAHLHVGSNRLRLTTTRVGIGRRKPSEGMLSEALRTEGAPLADSLMPLLERGAAVLGRALVDVTLDDRDVRLFAVKPPAGLRGLADVKAAAHLRFQSLFAVASMADWCLDAACHPTRAFVAVAMPRKARDELLMAFDAVGWPVRSLIPSFVRHAQQHRRALHEPATWLAVRADQAVTVWAGDADGGALRQTLLPESVWADDAAMAHWVETEALTLGLECPRTLLLTEGQAGSESAMSRRRIGDLTVVSWDGFAASTSIVARAGA